MREQVLQMYLNGGMDAFKTPAYVQLRAQHKFLHLDTCKRWIRLYHDEGHVLPEAHTGNSHSAREVNGIDFVNLALFRLVCPMEYVDEVRAYLHNRNLVNPPYSSSQIYCAEARLGLCQKVASSTSCEAYCPENIFKRNRYWGEPYPAGMNDQPTEVMIDIEEAGF
jgi:hypothetical protein